MKSRSVAKVIKAAQLFRTTTGRNQLGWHAIRRADGLLEPWRRVVDRATPSRVHCPCCGWHGRRFRTAYFQAYIRHNAQCPECGSLERHRAYAGFYKDAPLNSNASVLYFAPERSLKHLIQDKCGRLLTIDLAPRGVDLRADMTRLPFPDATFDAVIQHHVLEHIPDDAKALTEIRRVLRPGGHLFIAVLQDESLEETHDWGFPEPTKEGHFRDYGRDFGERLAAAGFEWESRDLLSGSNEAMRRKSGLGRREPLFVARKASACKSD